MTCDANELTRSIGGSDVEVLDVNSKGSGKGQSEDEGQNSHFYAVIE